VTWRSLGESLAAAFNAVGSAIVSRSGLVAAAVMVAALVGGYVVYRGTVLAARSEAPVTATVDTTSRPHKGPADAPLHLVEFADFECPHCKLAFQALEQVLAARDDVRVSFLHFPLDQACNPMIDKPFHPRACELATMGECAHAQGRFFDVAPLLFNGLPSDALLEALEDKGLDRKALEACMNDGAALARVRGDIEAGIQAEIVGTPALFLNGVLIGGAVPKDKLMSVLDQARQAPSLAAPEP
jgi:protein-disulfide isomerase